ncbi:HTH domain protein [Paucilactobacillus oligofermentans DSM 15707 = LMG 22743]|uniref:HTH domain protein n=1 Tax=Paucilactobacillus oligofermentans DSM 15707 = LMG 22743 TaxID=1423778 RepID=A0A0R1RDR3_9LACO|nr:PfkB family carbohydrate kinase [Paucilactobacillus oligofermentans]KRL54753.1 HTH domain protein [Paucilactobacillus oligofermentans DSM 15707 = LMG 22743]CUS26332.1 YeiC-like sugar kinase [Paucilactobacillus oligofermentans DSM 15707 = LMG 22743]
MNNKKITDREYQILQWIKQNPMIHQDELSKLAGISRSGIAAHISSLMKKGYIQGKGYVVSPKKYAVVIGGVNADIFGISNSKIMTTTSNSGKVIHSTGGIGRNIALNLTKLNIYSYLISAYGDDFSGNQFREDSRQNELDITYSKQFSNTATSSYIYINDTSGNRVIGLDDMEINNFITPSFLSERMEIIKNANEVIVDTNIPEDSIKWILDNYEGSIYIKAVSILKTKRLLTLLDRIDTLVINGVESPIISGKEIKNKDDVIKNAEKIISKGVKNVFIYTENYGMLYASKDNKCFIENNIDNRENTNGMGASVTAALVLANRMNLDFCKTAQLGYKAANITSKSIDSVSNRISDKELLNDL